jgi:hypothetical protein
MEMAGLKRLCVVAGLVTTLASCGGAGDDSTHAFLSPLKGGIWHGTDAATGTSIYGIVAESGEFQVLTSNGTQWTSQYSGEATYDHSVLLGTFEAFTFGTTVFANGGTHGTGSFGGAMNSGNWMNLDVSLLTDGTAVPLESTLDLTVDDSYRRPSSLARIGGSFGSGTDVLQVFSDGTVFAQFPGIGCTINGTVEVIDSLHNVYKLAFTFTGCTNGLTGDLEGLGTLDDSGTPQRLVGALSGGGTAFAFTLNRM